MKSNLTTSHSCIWAMPNRLFKRLLSLFVAAGLIASSYSTLTHACPLKGHLIDFNCDKKYRIAITGDSIAYGVGDELNSGRGGYALRLKKLLSSTTVYDQGIPGITSARLLAYYKQLFVKKPKSSLIRQLGTADILIIDVGRNDYFNRNPAALTVTTIKRLVKYLNTELKRRYGSAPLIVQTVLTPSNRQFDVAFITAINTALLKQRSNALPAYLRFDLLDPTLLSPDGLHPSSAGYNQLANLALEYIADGAQSRSLALRRDRDRDGIYDLFEKLKFSTNPRRADSDDDGLKDGLEVFTYRTNPNEPDTDGDGVDDKTEIEAGTNPRSPNDAPWIPPPTPTPEPTPSISGYVAPNSAEVALRMNESGIRFYQ